MPQPGNEVLFDCPGCGGGGCEHCDQGKFALTGCPWEVMTSDIWQLIDLVGLYKNGLPPIVGGSLDQAYFFTKAAAFIWKEQCFWKDKLERD